MSEHVEIQQPLEVTATPTQRRPKSPWKLILILAISLIFIIVINVHKPTKLAMLEAGKKIQSLGWYGNAILVLIIGCIVLPFGLPFIVFEMLISLLVENFWGAVCICIGGSCLGWGIVFAVTKNYIRERVLPRFNRKRFYRGLNLMIARNPFRFSFIVRIINFPYFIKNYGLAIPECIDFKTYIVSAFLGTTPKAMIEIYLFQKIPNIDHFVNGDQGELQKILSILLIVISILCVIYLLCYTKQVMKEIHEEGRNASIDHGIEGTHHAHHQEVGSSIDLF